MVATFFLTQTTQAVTSLSTVLFKGTTATLPISQTDSEHATAGAHAAHTLLANVALKWNNYGSFYKMKITGMDFDGWDMSGNFDTELASDITFLAGGSDYTNIGVDGNTSGEVLDLNCIKGSSTDVVFLSAGTGITAANTYAASSTDFLVDLYMGQVAEDVFTDPQYIKLFDNEKAVRETVATGITSTAAKFNTLASTGTTWTDAKDLSSDAATASAAQLMFNDYMKDGTLSGLLQTRLDEIATAVGDNKSNVVTAGTTITNTSSATIGEYADDAAADVVRNVIIYLPVAVGDTISLNSYLQAGSTYAAAGVEVIAAAQLGADSEGGTTSRYHKNYRIVVTATATN